MRLPYKRILLKLSGEILAGSHNTRIDRLACQKLAKAIFSFHQLGLEMGIVIGGGNIFRGIQAKELGLARTPADQIGMLATLMNGIALQNTLEQIGCPTTLMSALDCPKVAEPYNWKKAMESLSQGAVTIFVGGTGSPYFTTDTAAALRASEIQAEALLKATKVDGVYDKDPHQYPDAHLYPKISYAKYLSEDLRVMDATSIALCMKSQIPILVFNMNKLFSPKVKEIFTRGTLIS